MVRNGSSDVVPLPKIDAPSANGKVIIPIT
jgi:hypothetical protein